MTDEIITTPEPTPVPKAKASKPKGGIPASIRDASKVSLAALNQALAARHKVTPMNAKLFRDHVRRNMGHVSKGYKLTTSDIKALDTMYADRKKRASK